MGKEMNDWLYDNFWRVLWFITAVVSVIFLGSIILVVHSPRCTVCDRHGATVHLCEEHARTIIEETRCEQAAHLDSLIVAPAMAEADERIKDIENTIEEEQ